MTFDLGTWNTLVEISRSVDDGRELSFERRNLDHNSLVTWAISNCLLPRTSLISSSFPEQFQLPPRTVEVLSDQLWLNQQRTLRFVDCAIDLSRALTERNIRFVFTKGIIEHSRLYGGDGGRVFGDIDIMVHPDDRDELKAVVLSLGFLSSMRECRDGTLIPLSKHESMIYELYPDHFPHFYSKQVYPGIGRIVIDVAFNMTWFGSYWNLPLSEVFENVEYHALGMGEEVPAMSAKHSFCFLVLHCFRECWFFNAEKPKLIRLQQFADIVLSYEELSVPEVSELRFLVSQNSIERPFYWVTSLIDSIFGSNLVSGLGLSDCADETWLGSLKGPGQSYFRWDRDIGAWLREGAPLGLIAIDSSDDLSGDIFGRRGSDSQVSVGGDAG